MTNLTVVARTIKTADLTADRRADLNGLLVLAKGHAAVVAAYDKGGDVLAKAHKVGALMEDYKGLGRELHQEACTDLVARINGLLTEWAA